MQEQKWTPASMGRKGGKSKSEKKRKAAQENLKKAMEARKQGK